MSINFLKKVFSSISNIKSPSIQLLRITNTKEKTFYYSRQINIKPEKEIYDYLQKLSEKYGNEIERLQSLYDYKGDIEQGNYYKLFVDDELIKDNYDELEKVLADPSVEGNVDKGNWNALMIKGNVTIEDEEVTVKLFSMRTPISELSNKLVCFENDVFKKVSYPILSLSKTIDAIIVNRTFYILNMQAEKLFNMERSYRIRCDSKVDEIINLGILTDNDIFRETASRGQNPRRFVSFSQERMNALKNPESRKKYMQMFNIIMKGNKIDSKADKASERLVKFLCNKAMLDPVDEGPREVTSAREWA